MTTHHHAGGASQNVAAIALDAIKEKIHYPSPRLGASKNVSTLALDATEEKFEDSSLLLSKFQKKT
ncbi:MAG: hypothetical protein F6K22_17150 [Okeania sp. SIO2F4]|nr:hypothetical protein [Okeania sp. SIO2F4]